MRAPSGGTRGDAPPNLHTAPSSAAPQQGSTFGPVRSEVVALLDLAAYEIGEIDMRSRTLVAWLVLLGFAVWWSGLFVDTQPVFALAVGLAVLLFSAFAVAAPNPKRN